MKWSECSYFNLSGDDSDSLSRSLYAEVGGAYFFVWSMWQFCEPFWVVKIGIIMIFASNSQISIDSTLIYNSTTKQ